MYFRDKIDTLEEDREELINENKGNEKISRLLDRDSLREKLRYLRELKDSDKTLKGCTGQSSWNRNKKKICEDIIEDIQNTIKQHRMSRRRRSTYTMPSSYQNQYSS